MREARECSESAKGSIHGGLGKFFDVVSAVYFERCREVRLQVAALCDCRPMRLGERREDIHGFDNVTYFSDEESAALQVNLQRQKSLSQS